MDGKSIEIDVSALNAPAAFVVALIAIRMQQHMHSIAMQIGSSRKGMWLYEKLRACGYRTQYSSNDQRVWTITAQSRSLD